MESQTLSASEYQKNVIADLKYRVDKQTRIAQWYEQEFIKTINKYDNPKTEWDFLVGGTAKDLQWAHGFPDERDSLRVECLAMRERFGDELRVQPLVVPENLKTKSQIEEEQLANMHEGVLKQFRDTYKALRKWLVEPGCPGYEQLRVEHMNPERETLENEREAIRRPFFVEGENGESGGFASFLEAEEDCFFGRSH